MGRTLLLVIDKQRDFEDDRGALTSGAAAQATTPFVVQAMERAIAEGHLVGCTLDTHQEGTPEFEVWGRAEFEKFGPHCLRYSWGWQLVDGVQAVVDRQRRAGKPLILIEKPTFDAFHGRIADGPAGDIGLTLDAYVLRHGVTRLELAGLVTPICVNYTAQAARRRGLEVVVYEAGVASFSPESHRQGLDEMRAAGCQIVPA